MPVSHTSLREYVVAIPSYKRPDTLHKRTMRLLKEYKIDPKRIFVFVANAEEEKEYKETLNASGYNNKITLVIGKLGIRNIRNFMANYFREGQYIVYIDDDIYGIYEAINNISNKEKKYNRLQKLKSLKEFIKNAFTLSERSGLTNWGIYPVHNPFFMKATSKDINDYVSTRLAFLEGGFTGVINNRKAEERSIDDKEDYERTIKYYLKDNGVLRFNNISLDTKCYTEPGGMKLDRTKKTSSDSAIYLTKTYPELTTYNTSRKSGFAEILLRDKRVNRPEITLNKRGERISLKYPNKDKLNKKSKKKNNNFNIKTKKR